MAKKPVDEQDTLYKELATETPEREVKFPEDGDKAKSLTEREDTTPDLSDMQTAVKELFQPEAMVGRIAPDVFLDLLYLKTNADLAATPEEQPIDVIDTLLRNYTSLSIGLDGKGRIDILELAGASREIDELKKLSKDIF